MRLHVLLASQLPLQAGKLATCTSPNGKQVHVVCVCLQVCIYSIYYNIYIIVYNYIVYIIIIECAMYERHARAPCSTVQHKVQTLSFLLLSAKHLTKSSLSDDS